MALQKTFKSRFGVDGNYLRIVQIDIKAKAGLADIMVDVYKDKAARDAKKAPLEFFGVQIKGSTFAAVAGSATSGDTMFNEIAKACYNHLKTLPKFAGSQDV